MALEAKINKQTNSRHKNVYLNELNLKIKVNCWQRVDIKISTPALIKVQI